MREETDYNEALEFCEHCEYCTIEPWGKTIDHLRLTVIGKEGTPYEDGKFIFEIKFPKDYPNVPPYFYCTTKLWHPNIDPSKPPGRVNMSVDLLDLNYINFTWGWRPPFSNLKDAIEATISLIHLKNRITGLILNPQAEKQYRSNPERFERKAREFTRKYAIQEFLEKNR
ncbi:MAG: ubiquitin-conjugating enzyme E2 [Promethearchaeota archaeon]|jgi:ubiquitin-conjugating enzyme E2 D/E